MFWASFVNSENRNQIDKNPCTTVQVFNWFSATFLKSLPFSNETWASDECIPNCSGMFWASFVNSENRNQIDKNPCTIEYRDLIDFQQHFWNHSHSQTKHGLLTKLLTTFRDYLTNVLVKFRKFRKSHANWQKPMNYSTGISWIFSDNFKITAILKQNMGFWRMYSQLFRTT